MRISTTQFLLRSQPSAQLHRQTRPFADRIFGTSTCVYFLGENLPAQLRTEHKARRARCSGIGVRCRATSADAGAASIVDSSNVDLTDVAVIIVDHGSRRAASNHMLEQFGEVFQLGTGHKIVEVAHMEIAEPSILQAVAKCVERGATSIVIAPYFLSRGRHIQTDIPALVEEARVEFPDIKCTIADPIGIDQMVVRVIESRVAAAVNRAD